MVPDSLRTPALPLRLQCRKSRQFFFKILFLYLKYYCVDVCIRQAASLFKTHGTGLGSAKPVEMLSQTWRSTSMIVGDQLVCRNWQLPQMSGNPFLPVPMPGPVVPVVPVVHPIYVQDLPVQELMCRKSWNDFQQDFYVQQPLVILRGVTQVFLVPNPCQTKPEPILSRYFRRKKNRMARGVSPPRHPICCSHGRTAST